MTHSAFDTVTDDAPAASPSGRRPGLSPFYLEERDIQEGVTCAEWRGRRRRDEEHHEGDVVVCAGHLEGGFQAFDFGVANVCSGLD